MLSIILYYLIISSSILIYGIGIERSVQFCFERKNNIFIHFFKMLCLVVITSVLTYLFSCGVLFHGKINDLFPFFAVIILIVISFFLEIVVRIVSKTKTSEFTISYMIVLLSVSESLSLVSCILISCICVLSFFVVLPVLNSIVHHMKLKKTDEKFEFLGFVYVSLAIIMLSLLTWNVTWINKGVFQW